MRKITILLLFAVMAFTFDGWGQVIISQYYEGSSNNKWLELTNVGASSVDLTGYYLGRWSNTETPSGDAANYTDLTGITITVGQVILFQNAAAVLPTYASGIESTATYFNGNDPVALCNGSYDWADRVDCIYGNGYWGDEKSFYRTASVLAGNVNISVLDGTGEWLEVSNATVDGATAGTSEYLGSHVYNSGGGNLPPTITNILTDPASGGITSSSTVSVSASITDDGTITSAYVQWGTTSGSLTNTINMAVGTAPTYATVTDIPAQTVGTTVYYKVFAQDNDTELSESAELSYSVLYPATAALPYDQAFDADLGSCFVYSVLGATKTWGHASYGGNGYANANGYNSGEIEEDWLVIPAIDFDSYASERMTFDTWYNYGVEEDEDNYLKLMWSSDYMGYGDPTLATWTEISFATAASTNEWASSGTIDLSGITGSNIHLAFKYNYQVDNWRWWQVDNLAIYEAIPVNVTFQVNMAEQTVSPNGVHVAGSFNSWTADATPMLDPDLDGVYEATVSLISGLEYQFKYINGDAWGTNGEQQEIVPAECQASGSDNRFEIVGDTDYAIDPVCYGSCNDCGTPQFDITFSVDMQNEVVSGDGVYLAGSLTNWGTGAVLMTATGSIWSVTVSADELSNHQYKFVNGNPNSGGSWENFDGPCLPTPWGNREIYLGQENITADLVCFNSCDACPAADFVMINEVDADTPSSDTEEFIELYDGGVGNTDLSGLVVVLYNGSDDKSYTPAIDLDGYTTNAEGYFVIGSTGMGTDIEIDPGGSGWLQNGADGVALHIGNDSDYPNDTPVSDVNLIDALVYDTYDNDDSGLLDVLTPGQPQINEGGRGDKDNHSNQRIPNGTGGMRMTMTYDQSPTTTTAENIGIFIDWTGDVDSDWFNAGNWSTGIVPTTEDVTILAIDASLPTISGGTATCAALTVEAGATLTLATDGYLTATGASTFEGDLYIMSDATGNSGSFIDNGTIAGAGNLMFARDIVSSAPTGDEHGWHLISSPLGTNYTNYNMYDYYVNTWDETVPTFVQHVGSPTIPCTPAAEITLNPMMGWSVKQDLAYECEATNPGTGSVLHFDGAITDVNIGAQSIAASYTANATAYDGYNLVGNPYTSGVEASSIAFGADLDGSVNTWNAGTHQYDEWTSAAGSYVIAPTQGFWVMATAPTTFDLAGTERAHGGMFYKESLDNVLQLSVIGNGNYDETFVRFMEGTSAGYDLHLDGKKMFSTGMPSLYTTSAGQQLAIDAQSATEQVAMSFSSETPGTYTVEAFETSNFTNVYLQDLQSGVVTDLLAQSHEFNHTDGVQNFIIHFAPVGINEINANTVKIWASDNNIIVNVLAEVTGDIVVYNMMGQEVLRTSIEGTETKISVPDVSTNYVVKVISNSNTVTGKVYVK